jgi:hypothetical protein
MTATENEAQRFARHLAIQSRWPLALAATFLVVQPLVLTRPPASVPAVAFIVLAIVFALATIALSMLILFDALLFRMIASHGADEAGCAAVDDILSRMRLKPVPSRNRPLAERIAGTKRLLVRQRAACFLFLAAAAAALFAERL